MYVEAVHDLVLVHRVPCGFAELVAGCLVVHSVRVIGVIGCQVVHSMGCLRLFRWSQVRSKYWSIHSC